MRRLEKTTALSKNFGLLTVIKIIEVDRHGKRTECICKCGKKTIVYVADLIRGHKTSCGCRKDSVLGESRRTHGKSGTPTYLTWKRMRSRCNNPNLPYYRNWGGRGIRICKRWDKFENFLQDMGEVPKRKSLDRINNNGNYCKKNCRWATKKEQANNTRPRIKDTRGRFKNNDN